MFIRNLICSAVLAVAVIAPTVAQADCNGTGFVRAESSANRYFRPVEDFIVPQGNGGKYRISSMFANIATNVPLQQPGAGEVWFEIYRANSVGAPGTRIFSTRATSVTTITHGWEIVINGAVHRKWVAGFNVEPALLPEISPGERLFVGVYVKAAFTASQSAWVMRQIDQSNSPGSTRIQLSALGGWSSLPASDCDLNVNLGLRQFCIADFNRSGDVDPSDAQMFVQAYLAHNLLADMNGDHVLNQVDIALFSNAYHAPCTTY